MKNLESKILEINKKTEEISEFVLWFAEKFEFQNWQFLTIDIPQKKIIERNWEKIEKEIFVKRAYSIVDVKFNEKNNSWKIFLWIKNVNWIWTSYLFSRKIWEKLNIKTSFWNFFVKWEKENLFFLATWIWIPPIISHLKKIFEQEKNFLNKKKIFLSYWVRKKENFFIWKILEKFSEENKNFSYKIFFSREDEKISEENKNFEKWYCTEFLKNKNLDFKNSEFYFCWSVPLMKEIWEKLEKYWVWKEDFIFEAY